MTTDQPVQPPESPLASLAQHADSAQEGVKDIAAGTEDILIHLNKIKEHTEAALAKIHPPGLVSTGMSKTATGLATVRQRVRDMMNRSGAGTTSLICIIACGIAVVSAAVVMAKGRADRFSAMTPTPLSQETTVETKRPDRSVLHEAYVAFNRKDYTTALECFAAARSAGSDVILCLSGRGHCFLKLGRYDDALMEASILIAAVPNCKEAYLLRGLVFAKRGDTEQAKDELRKAIQFQSKEAAAALDHLNGVNCCQQNPAPTTAGVH